MAQVSDYVIVGAGSAGCVLAARLSENPDISVTLLEAGGPDSVPEMHIPAALGMLMKSRLDWDFDTEPERDLLGRRAYLPRGRTLGGSSSTNAMIYVRGNRADYDGWADAGATGWAYDDVLPYFIRSEDNDRGESAFHGVGGPLGVSDSRSNHPLVDRFVEAAVAAGHPQNPDFNADAQEGVGRYQFTQRNGMRCSTAAGFLRPAAERPNLTILTGARALRVMLDGSRATGVEVDNNGMVEQIQAGHEVIVCAGAYQSPQLLLLSGIGPAEELAMMQIEPRADLPVGRNLQDHIMVVPSWVTSEETLMSAFTPENFELLQSSGSGPLTSNAAEGGGFFHSRSGLSAPDIQLHVMPLLIHEEALGAPIEHAVSMFVGAITPTSRGTVTLRSPLPDAKPRIAHNYLSTQEDRDALIAALRLTMDLMSREPIADFLTGPFNAPADDSEETLTQFIRAHGQSLYHPTSSCSIGQVVDPELKVLGIEGLRVADASVMPVVTRGNTNAPSIMIGEKAADLITARAPVVAGQTTA